jgi:hypothetical protein
MLRDSYKRWRTRLLLSKLEVNFFSWRTTWGKKCDKYFLYLPDYLEDVKLRDKALYAIFLAIESNPNRATPKIASLVLHYLDSDSKVGGYTKVASSVLGWIIRKNPAIANEKIVAGIYEHIGKEYFDNRVVFELVRANPKLADERLVRALSEFAHTNREDVAKLFKTNPNLASIIKLTPSEEQYVKECLQQKYEELTETRSWESDSAFKKVTDRLNSGDNIAVCREAESLIVQYHDFSPLYYWWGSALIRMGSLDKARQVLIPGLDRVKQKYLLCNLLGEIEWKARELNRAVLVGPRPPLPGISESVLFRWFYRLLSIFALCRKRFGAV